MYKKLSKMITRQNNVGIDNPESDGDGYFESVSPKDKMLIEDTFPFSATYGCSCYEILSFMPEIDKEQLDYGCSKGTINVFSRLIGWARRLFG